MGPLCIYFVFAWSVEIEGILKHKSIWISFPGSAVYVSSIGGRVAVSLRLVCMLNMLHKFLEMRIHYANL